MANPRGSPKHLYVALDDWNGHALYKLNVDDLAGDESDMDSDEATGGTEEPQLLPQPVLRLSFRSFGGAAQFNALGSKIVVTTGSRNDGREGSKCLNLVYDTKTAKQDVWPSVPDGLTGCYHAVAAGNKLYAFSPHRPPLYYLRDARAHPESDDDDALPAHPESGDGDAQAHLESDDNDMDESESADDDDESESVADDDDGESESAADDDESDTAAADDESEYAAADDESEYAAADDESESDDSDEDDPSTLRERAEEQWTWKRSPMSIPCGAGNAASLKTRTFYVTSGMAVHLHPDEHTIFLSTVDEHRPRKEIMGTFSLDTDQPGGGWTRLGNWHLPFMSKAHYDCDLDAWVGIEYSEDTDSHHLCCCDLPDDTGGNPTPRPDWKLCKEKLTFMQAPLSAMCRTLVHTGRGRFGLVEVAQLKRSKARPCLGVDQDHLLQVTMFRASYGKKGELMATPLRPGRLYRMPSYNPISINQPPAFWM